MNSASNEHRRATGSAAALFHAERERCMPTADRDVVTRVPTAGKNGVKPWTVTDIDRDATILRRPK